MALPNSISLKKRPLQLHKAAEDAFIVRKNRLVPDVQSFSDEGKKQKQPVGKARMTEFYETVFEKTYGRKRGKNGYTRSAKA